MAFLTKIVTKLVNVHVKYLILYDFKQNLNSTNFRKISNVESREKYLIWESSNVTQRDECMDRHDEGCQLVGEGA